MSLQSSSRNVPKPVETLEHAPISLEPQWNPEPRSVARWSESHSEALDFKMHPRGFEPLTFAFGSGITLSIQSPPKLPS